MIERLSSHKNLTIEKAALLFMGIFLFVLNYPHAMTIRETSFFLAIILAALTLLRNGRWEWSPLKVQFLLWIGVAFASLAVSSDVWFSLSEIKKEIVYGILSFWLFYVMTKNRKDFVFLSCFVLVSATLAITISSYLYFMLGYNDRDLSDTALLFAKPAYFSFFMLSTLLLPSILAMY